MSQSAIVDRAIDAWMEEDIDVEAETENYRRGTLKKITFIVILLAIAVIAAGFAMSIGTYPIDFLDTYRIVWDHFFGEIQDADADYLIFEWRLPRICTGILAGIGLAAAGVVMQSILRNPLADPYTTGISSGASFGATLAIGFGISVANGAYAIVIGAFVFSLIPTVVILAVSKMRGASPTTMIMAGIAVMYIFNAMTTMIKLFVSPDQLAAIFAWSVGSIDGATWTQVGTMLTFVTVGYLVLQLSARKLNVLSTGDESSRSIGIDANKLRLVSLLVVSFLTAGVVSFTGLIGFIGLVCPHIARIFVGSDNRYLIPASAAFGAALLTIADIIGKTVIYPTTIQVGVITAFIGGPLFLYLIVKQKKESW